MRRVEALIETILGPAGAADPTVAAPAPHPLYRELIAGVDSAPDAGPTVVVGRFPGLDEKLPGALVLERNPGPRDLPEAAAERVLPTARRVIITASTLANHSLPRLLALARRAEVSVIGP